MRTLAYHGPPLLECESQPKQKRKVKYRKVECKRATKSADDLRSPRHIALKSTVHDLISARRGLSPTSIQPTAAKS